MKEGGPTSRQDPVKPVSLALAQNKNKISRGTMIKKLPDFNSEGVLPKGIHVCSGQEFLQKFCSFSAERQSFEKPVADILDYSKLRNARYLFVGGSFVTNKEKPNDLDMVIVFSKSEFIPQRSERLAIEGRKLDVMFCAQDDPKLVDAFLVLLSEGRYGRDSGLVQIDLYDDSLEWQIRQYPDEETYELVKRVYINRSYIDLNEPEGILVSIHGLLSNGSWNSEIAPIASSQGWTFAPFSYGKTTPDVLLREDKRREIVDKFRDWIFKVKENYEGEISVIAHSFGTYILGAYMAGFEVPPVQFNSVILTGSILTRDFDWEAARAIKVCRVLNEVAPNDQWVSWMPNRNWFGTDKLFGSSGVDGFTAKSDILTESTNNIFVHDNVIRRDVITQKWMPFLNANKNAHWYEYALRNKKAFEIFEKQSSKKKKTDFPC
jgi:hypothetical protein